MFPQITQTQLFYATIIAILLIVMVFNMTKRKDAVVEGGAIIKRFNLQ